MVKFTGKCFLLMMVLFFGVLIGMQHANQSMKKMKGFDDPALYSALAINETEKGQKEASILGEKVTSHDLKEKKQQLENMKAYNFFSQTGKKVSDGISGGFNTLMKKIAE
ncbi:nitrogen fixation protein FixH [Peribacillus deserti]|uniref:Nitrogen fixation protein FixH n=1 Tax=Peribacillus deserti TaxID=673318 RepID=A0ABS2QFA6_9BACI|nr:nitrogen fixation protein FixH [Peribacillus deserti]